MALKDYLSEGTYSLIDAVVYNKTNRHLRCDLHIYVDDTKKCELAKKVFMFEGLNSRLRIKGIIEDKLPNPEVGEFYFVSPKSTALPDRVGTWAHFHGRDLESEDKGWEYWGINVEAEKFYYIPLDCYCVFNEDQEMEKIPADLAKDKVWWDKWFSSSVGKNLHTQIYSYLKTLPGFETVKDA
jgi:hypothetical protein